MVVVVELLVVMQAVMVTVVGVAFLVMVAELVAAIGSSGAGVCSFCFLLMLMLL